MLIIDLKCFYSLRKFKQYLKLIWKFKKWKLGIKILKLRFAWIINKYKNIKLIVLKWNLILIIRFKKK